MLCYHVAYLVLSCMHQTLRGDVLGQDYNGQEKKKDKILKFFKTLKEL